MNPPLPQRGTLRGAIMLAGVAAGVAVIALACGDGSPSWRRAVAFSGGLCLASSLTGWAVARWPYRSPATAVAGGLAATAVRLFGPLAGLAWLHGAGHAWREAGADRLLLAFYLSLLATDIAVNIISAERSSRTGGGNAAN